MAKSKSTKLPDKIDLTIAVGGVHIVLKDCTVTWHYNAEAKTNIPVHTVETARRIAALLKK